MPRKATTKKNKGKAAEKPADRRDRLDETFHKLMMCAIEEAERVECSMIEFRNGLAVMFSALRERLNQVDDEIGNKTETEPQEVD